MLQNDQYRQSLRAASREGVGAEPVGYGSLGWRLAATSKAARDRFELALRAAGGSFATWKVLELLSLRGPMIQRDLAAALDIESPTLTRQIDRLERERLVVRQPDPGGDRRTSQVALTEAGRGLHRALVEVARQVKAAAVEGLSPAEVAELERLLAHVYANVADTPGPRSANQPEQCP